MKKLIQNKKLVFFSGVVLVLLIGAIIWACVSCSDNKPKDAFSEEGMNVVEEQDEDETDEMDGESELEVEEEEIKAPSNWGDDNSSSIDSGGNLTQTPEDESEEGETDSKDEKEDEEADTTSGYGKPF